MPLLPLDILNGSLSIFACVISAIVGLKIISKYFKYKRQEFLLVGIVGILLTEPWWPSGISFIVALFNDGVGLAPQIYFIIGNVGLPFAIVCWLIAFTELLYKQKQKLIVLLGIIWGTIFEVIFFILLFIEPSLIGHLESPTDVEYRYFVLVYLLSVVVFILITGLRFAKESLKSSNKEMRLRGKFMSAAFITFCVGALLDSAMPLNAITLIFTRVLLISCALEFYNAFIMPEWTKKIFLKEEGEKKESKLDISVGSIEKELVKKEIKVSAECLARIKYALNEYLKVDIELFKDCLQLDENTFGDKIFDWSTDFGLKIEGKYLTINEEKIPEFIKIIQSSE